MLVETFDVRCGASSPSPTDRGAVLSAPPGASEFQVVVSAEMYFPAPHGGGLNAGFVAASPNASVYALCFARPGTRQAELVDVVAGDALVIHRTSDRAFAPGSFPSCSASDTGVAVMELAAHTGRNSQLLATDRRIMSSRPPPVRLAPSRSVRPDGR